MNKEKQRRISKKLSYHLRHDPGAIDLTLGDGGWVAVPELLAALAWHRFPVTGEELDAVVAGCEKQRFSYDAGRRHIRANQGHSVPVDLKLEETFPPETLYHGTVRRYVHAIMESGLLRMARHHVHLTVDKGVAAEVGSRRGRPVVLAVDARGMAAAGHKFFVSANGVWLTDSVPSRYLSECGL